MNIENFDKTRGNPDNLTYYDEAVRLSNELRAVAPSTVINVLGERIDLPGKWGFDCETAPYSDFTTWLNDNTIKKSQSLFWFVIRVMVWRFPDKATEIRNNLTPDNQEEFDLIQSESRHEIEFLGEVGFSNKVRLDKKLNNPRNRTLKGKNENIKVVRK
jgi:hypothetical protein